MRKLLLSLPNIIDMHLLGIGVDNINNYNNVRKLVVAREHPPEMITLHLSPVSAA